MRSRALSSDLRSRQAVGCRFVSIFHDLATTELLPADFVRANGSIETEFSEATQGSGNISWLVMAGGERLFVKSAGIVGEPEPGMPRPYFDHAGRVALLRNAVTLARSCQHSALAELINVIESPGGPMLVYRAVPGELVGVVSKPVPGGSARLRADPTTAYQRFAHLPAPEQLTIFDTLIALHRELAAQGWVAVDLYDGCMIVDLSTLELHVIDLDTYRRGPSVNDMGRMFGSERFMAPEEFELGATIDQRTTVFTLGRLVWHFGTRLTEDADRFCGPAELAAVVGRATEADRDRRHPDVASLAAAWWAARRSAG